MKEVSIEKTRFLPRALPILGQLQWRRFTSPTTRHGQHSYLHANKLSCYPYTDTRSY